MYSVTWMLGTITSFCLMAVGVRELSGEINTFQILFYRSAIGLLLVSFIIVTLKKHRLFTSRRLGLHLSRNIFHYAGQYGWYLGIGLLPLAEVFALEFTIPIWTAIIASLFLKEKLTIKKSISIALGMIGVLAILKPGYEIIDAASFIVLGAALCYSISHTYTKSLSSTEKPVTILFFMCLVQLPIGLACSLSDWRWPNPGQWLWLVIIGFTALSAHFCLTKAMQHAEVSKIITWDFLRLPLIAIIGVVLYNEHFDIAIIIGGIIILFGNLLNFHQSGTAVGSATAQNKNSLGPRKPIPTSECGVCCDYKGKENHEIGKI